MISAAGAHAKGSVNQLHRKKAAERGRAALRRARQERRAAELSRSLQRAERDNQLHRAQHDTAMDASPVASQVPQDQENMQHEAAASMHQPASCKAQLTAGGTAAAAKPGMSCQQAKQAATPQRAPVEVIAQTQWQLQSVRPESHDFLRNSAGRLQRITAAVSKAAHGKVPSSVPPRQGMARERHASGGRKMLPAKSILKQGNAERVQSTVLRLQKGTAQSATKTPVAMKQLKRSAITKYALESRQDGSDDRVPSLLGPAVSGQRTQVAEGCSVGTTTQTRGSPLPFSSHRRSACASSSAERRSISACPVSAPARHSRKASNPAGQNVPVFPSAPARTQQTQSMAMHNACRRRLFFNPLADSSTDIMSENATQHLEPTAVPAEACGANRSGPCSASEDLPWPAMFLEHQACAISRASAAELKGGNVFLRRFTLFLLPLECGSIIIAVMLVHV